MPWLEATATVITAADLAVNAGRKLDYLQRHWKRLSNRIQSGSLQVAVFGSGGVGKTTLSKIIAGEIDPATPLGPYFSSQDIEAVKLTKDVPGMIHTVPGQKYHVSTKWHEIERGIINSVYDGIVFVSAFGFHSSKASIQFTDEVQASNIEMELEHFFRITDCIKKAKKTPWLLTVFNKEDLWFDRTEEVKELHEKRFRPVALQLRDAVGANHLMYDFTNCALGIQNLRSRDNNTLSETVAGYDSMRQQYTVSQLLELIDGLANRIGDLR